MRSPLKRGGIRSILILLSLLAGHTSPESIIWGVPFLLVGIAIRLWAKGCLHQNKEITTSGPYRFVRHPFYLGNLFLDASIVVFSGWIPLICVFPFWWIAIYLPTMRREEASLMNLFGEAYHEYARRVPLLIPFRRPLPPGPGFSWRNENIVRTELPRTFRFLSYPFLFIVSSQIRADGLLLGSDLNPVVFHSLLMCSLFAAAAWEWARHYKHQRTILPAWFSQASARLLIFVGIIGFGACVTYRETEMHFAILPIIVLLTGLSVLLHKRSKQTASLGEFAFMIGFAVYCELPWLSVPLLILYSAILLDEKLARSASPSVASLQFLNLVPQTSHAYSIMVFVGLLVGTMKEILTNL
jgi:hypothetical protein